MFTDTVKYVLFTCDHAPTNDLFVYTGQAPEYMKVDKVLYEAVPKPAPCCPDCKEPYTEEGFDCH
jgi:hypothetical protein